MKLFLVRHGETDYNVQKRIQGHLDIPLNENGIEISKKIVEKLPSKLISKIFCSDLKRAKKTAEIINDTLKIPIVFDPRLRERKYGDWEGITWNEVYQKNPDLKKLKKTHPLTYKAPGGETGNEILRRISEFLTDLHDDKGDILIVSHSGPIRAFIVLVKQISPDLFYEIHLIKNSQIVEIDLAPLI